MSLESQVALHHLYDELNVQVENKRCRRCRGMVWVAYIDQTWRVRCNCYPTAPQMVEVESYSQVYRRGGVLPSHIHNILERQTGGLMTQALTQQDAERQIQTAFGSDLATSEVEKATKLVQLGLDPALHIMVYQHRVSANIDGLYYYARTHLREPWEIVSEPIMGNEQRAAYGVKADEIAVIAKLYRVGSERPACTGFGRASTNKYSPVMRGSAVEYQHPYRMAEKRAEGQALRKFATFGKQGIPDVLFEPEDTASDPNVVIVDPAPITWANECLTHNVPWVHGRFSLFHADPKCDLKQALLPLMAELVEDVVGHMKTEYGTTWAGAKDEDRLHAYTTLSEDNSTKSET